MTQPIHDSWTIARSAILTHQHRMAITANNIANVDTPGYSRRYAVLTTVPETPSIITDVRTWSNGAGVRVGDVVRANNVMTAAMLRDQVADTSAHEGRAQALGSLEALLREDGDSSLGARLDAFWNAWYDLSNQADNIGFRSVVAQRGHELATHIRDVDGRITDFETQLLAGVPGSFSGQMARDVNDFNQLTLELQDLNQRISYARGGFEPHDLMDRRDVLLREISEIADVTVGEDYAVTLGGETLVSADGSVRATLEIADAGPPPVFELDGVAVGISAGALGAWVDVLAISDALRTRLDLLTGELVDAVNSIHNSDLNPAGDSYDLTGSRCDWDFFTGHTAEDIAVNTAIYDPANPMSMAPERIAAAASYYDDGTGVTGANSGDGARALEIADLSTAVRTALDDQGFGDFHVTGLTLLGGVITTEQSLADAGVDIIGAIEDDLQAEIGVNLDEELMDMMSAQRAFQAASRLLQSVDEVMQTILKF